MKQELRNFAPKIIDDMMRLLTTVLLVLALFSCGKNRGVLERIETIKSVGDDNPQLALRMLDSLQTEHKTMGEYERMKMELLQVRLRDKAYITATSDLRIKPVVEYFEVEGTDKERQEAHYYAGSVYRDLQDTPRALEHFLRAEEICADDADYDTTMLINTYSNLHWLYYNVQDYDNALAMAQKDRELAEGMNKADISTYIHLGASYLRLDKPQQAKRAFVKALEVYRRDGGMSSGEDLSSMLYSFAVLGMRQEATECFNRIMAAKGGIGKTADYHIALGTYHEMTGSEAEAIDCYQRAMADTTNMEGRYDASKALFRIYTKRKDVARANCMAETFINVSDSINLGERQRLAATVNNAFHYHRNQREEAKMREDSERYRILFVGIALVAEVVVLVCVLALAYTRNRRLKDVLGKTTELRQAKQLGQQLSADIAEQDRELAVAREALKKKTAELRQMKAQLAVLYNSDMEASAEDTVNVIRNAADGKYSMKAADWRCFYQAMEELYPTLRDEMTKRHGQIDEQQMQLCYLLHAGFTPAQIQNIIPRSRVTIWRWIKKFEEEVEED